MTQLEQGFRCKQVGWFLLVRRVFEEVTGVEAGAIGPPGQRRFRLLVEDHNETALLWMEKQQLQALGMAFEQILAQLQTVQLAIRPGDEDIVPTEQPEQIPGAYEYLAARLSVGFDDEHNLVVIILHEPETDDEDPPDFICRIQPEISGMLALQIRRVVSSGARTQSNGHLGNYG